MSEYAKIEKIISFFPIIIIILGLIGNTICFLMFRFSSKFNKIPSMVFLSFVAIFDTISLFEWNLNRFLYPNFLFALENLNLFSCKLVIFIQVFSLHSSANLLSLMCVDRFVSIKAIPGSFYSRLPFSTVKSSFIWSLFITIIMFLFNIHVLIFNGNYIKINEKNITELEYINGTTFNKFNLFNQSENCYWYSENFKIVPTLDRINFIVYNLIPFSLMVVFNVLLIVTTLIENKSSKYLSNKKALKSMRKKRRLTISILSISLAFILMTAPSSMVFGFFSQDIIKIKNGLLILNILDSIAFLFHSSLFFNCFITNIKFRKFCIGFFKKTIKKNEFNTSTQKSLGQI